ncbi:hypothetical protein R1sor_011313 [Riccia sorocarpa]|uniref:Uncharacterized protein n=1 Tax=Riccia sorocarpa TaxID=122646 RepID=A0ABD3I3A4_9MARC
MGRSMWCDLRLKLAVVYIGNCERGDDRLTVRTSSVPQCDAFRDKTKCVSTDLSLQDIVVPARRCGLLNVSDAMCELRITLDTSTAMCSVTCIHLEDHERPSWRDSKFLREALEFLDRVAEAGMRTADVYRLLRLQDHIDPAHITRAHVNYWVVEIESWRYGAGEPDQLKSSKDFIERPKNRAKGFELILYEETDEFETFSFLTPFWRETMRPESDPWYEQPAYVEHGMPEDIGIGGIDLNEKPIEMIPTDDPETEDGGADENVAAIAGLLAEVNVSGDNDSAGKAAPVEDIHR